jgi:hypothetical protein
MTMFLVNKMSSALLQFKKHYLTTDSISRFLLIEHIIEKNSSNAQIVNLVSKLNTMDTSLENQMKEDNIHFVCSQLVNITTFKF